jgi:hypothetical protein
MASRIQVGGANKVLKNIAVLTQAMSGEEAAKYARGAQWALQNASELITDEAKRNARGARVPADVVDSIFTYGGLPKSTRARKKPSALAGVAKQATMREWIATKNPKSPKAKVSPGGKVAMSRATMYEFGTTRQPAVAFFGRAVKSRRGQVRTRIAENLKLVIRTILQ